MWSTIEHISFNKKRAPIHHEPKRKKGGFPWKKLIISVTGVLLVLISGAWIYLMQGIPSIDGLEHGEFFRESSIIYDKDGNEIYSIYKDGKRTYIPYAWVSQSIIDAMISIEDKTFFENPGIDIMGLVRVWVSYLTNGKIGWRVGGASTISQQLIKNTLLTNEVTIKRKVQEAYLSYSMNSTYSKEKILEMYINTISFWHNASGIEQASRTFFGKSAKDVGPLGATILASLPNGPTKYSPYMHRDRLMGKLEVYPISDTDNRIILTSSEDKKTYAPLYNEFKSYLSGITMERSSGGAHICGVDPAYITEGSPDRASLLPDDDGCVDITFDRLDDFFGNISFSQELTVKDIKEIYTIEYTIGRKDFVATRMLEDDKIDGPTYKKIIYDGIDFEFRKYAENIKYPYFVMYVKEYLETKYGKDMDITSGLKIYTTIDPRLQEKAEEVVRKQVETSKKLYNASSAALISMDNTDGRLLAMVGGPDYFDVENGGNNNMTLSPRQPGSSFKPFVYAIAISKNPIGAESPVADTDTKFGSWHPDNYDGAFKWVMMMKNALNYSRNIPAGKMYFLAGGQDEIVKTMRKMWINTLVEEKEHSYGWPLALGAGEVKPIELMQAYSVLANNGIKRNLYSIEKIETNDGTIIEEHDPVEGIESFSPAAAYITNRIISDNSARPESTYWRNALTVAWRIVAAKTGTANKPAKKWTTAILPWDLWTAGYTPQITTVVWAGNVDGRAMTPKAESLNSAAPIWKAYMEFALKDLPKTDWKKPEGLYTYNIAKTSGKLATKNTPAEQTVSTLMAVKLDEYDDGIKEIQIDTLCNGIVTDTTPPDAIKTIYIPSGKPVIDGYDPEWTSSFFASLRKWAIGTGSTQSGWEYSDLPCESRPGSYGNVTLSIDIIDAKTGTVGFIGDRMISEVRIIPSGWDSKIVSYGTGSRKTGTENFAVNLTMYPTITVEVIDIYGYKYSQSKTLVEWTISSSGQLTVSGSTEPPVITMINPKWKNLNLYSGDPFNLRFRVDITTANREVQVLIDDVISQTATSGDVFVIPMSSAGLSEGIHTVSITAIDGEFRRTQKNFTLTVLAR
jgi:penicillin-binding protein 1A